MSDYKYLACERETLYRYADDSNIADVESFNFNMMAKLEKLLVDYPDDVKEKYRQPDGNGLRVLMPKKWIKIRPPRKMTDEQKQIARDRMNSIREKRTMPF